MASAKRREVFTSLFSRKREEKPLHVRPPYNSDESLFHKHCISCEDKRCVSVCEEEIIKIEDEIPYLDFSEGGCTFCIECAKACPEGVLSEDSSHKIDALFSINIGSCLAWNATMCSSCADSCDERAIEFLGVFRPTINKDRCTACGFCLAVCPVYSIEYKAIR